MTRRLLALSVAALVGGAGVTAAVSSVHAASSADAGRTEIYTACSVAPLPGGGRVCVILPCPGTGLSGAGRPGCRLLNAPPGERDAYRMPVIEPDPGVSYTMPGIEPDRGFTYRMPQIGRPEAGHCIHIPSLDSIQRLRCWPARPDASPDAGEEGR
ncbi:MAG: hypothetical protein JXR94_23725 [Candidatus Hydrogenedentes bacterium]|nr:hypothetical protein [Candidatus Hydrogenedentota bacterium]